MNKFFGGLLITVGFILGLSAVFTFFKKPVTVEDAEVGYAIGREIGFYIGLGLIVVLSYFLIRTGIRLIRRP